MCRVLEVSESGYFSWRKRPESQHAQKDKTLTETIKAIHIRSRGTYGAPRVQAELQAQGTQVSRARVTRLMKAAKLKVRFKRKFRTTTVSKHRHPVAQNLLERRGPTGCRFRQDSATLRRVSPMRSGVRILPTYRLERVGSTSRWCWTSIQERWWVGPCGIPYTRIWCSVRSRWPAGIGSRKQGCCITRIRECNMPALSIERPSSA